MVRALLLAGCLACAGAAQAETSAPTLDTFTATTVGMVPNGAALKIDIRDWSDAAGRTAVVAALDGDADANAVTQALRQLPTLGYVWQTGTAVGYAVKYAHRETLDGGERITFVTDRALGSYGSKPWTVPGIERPAPLPYSVIELELNGESGGVGTLSLAAEVALDPAAGTVSLVPAAGQVGVLTGVKLEPKPYWAAQK